VESPGMMCTAGAKLIPRKQHTKLTAFVARVWTAQWRQPVLCVCLWGIPFSGCRGCGVFIAENLRHCIQRCYTRRPAPQAEAARTNYNSNVLCSKSLSSAAEDEAGEGFSVEVQNCRIEVLFGWLSTNTIYCPLAHPNPMPYLVQRAKRQMQPTTRRGWTYAMMLCGAVY
jgi:hypothetical protein